MERRTPVFIVCSPRPRVGRTLLARVLTEFFRSEGRTVAAFDVNPDQFALVDHLPAFTAVATLTDTKGEMALFDQLIADDGVPKVVDLGHALFEKFFAVFQGIDFLREAQVRSVVPFALFLADPDRRAQQGYDMLRHRFPDLALVPVLNEALPTLARYRDNFPPTWRGGAPLAVPMLSPVLKATIDRPGFSFAWFLLQTTDPTNEIAAWTRRMFLEFRELELRMMLETLRPALRAAR